MGVRRPKVMQSAGELGWNVGPCLPHPCPHGLGLGLLLTREDGDSETRGRSLLLCSPDPGWVSAARSSLPGPRLSSSPVTASSWPPGGSGVRRCSWESRGSGKAFSEDIGARSGPGSVRGLGVPRLPGAGSIVGASDQNMDIQVNAIKSIGMDSRDRVMGVRFEFGDSQVLSEKAPRDTPR